MAEDIYGEQTTRLEGPSLASNQEPEPAVSADNAVFRRTATDAPRPRVQATLADTATDSGPVLSAPIDDPFADRGINLRTEHGDSMNGANSRRSGGRLRSAGYRQQENSTIPRQEIEDPAEGQDPGIDIQEASCDEYRQQLLNQPITLLDINISAPRPGDETQGPAMRGIARDWKDRYGNVVAHGSLIELRRGYAIIATDAGRQSLSIARLSDDDLGALAEIWRIPGECTLGDQYAAERCFVSQTYTWKASDLCHKPLYFEDQQLERYGHSAGPVLQPLKSTAHFFVHLASVPYQMGINPANECQYALGFYRPGNCAPWLCDPIPISLSGAANQALATTGVAFILP